MTYEFESITHVINTIKYALRRKGLHFSKYEESELYNIVDYAWSVEGDEKLLHEMKFYNTHLPVSTLTWYAFNEDYSDVKNYMKFASSLINQYRIFVRAINNNNVKSDNPCMNLIFRKNTFEISDFIKQKIEKNVTDGFVRDMESIKNDSGVYFLYDRKMKLIYVGKSIRLGERIVSSIGERKAHYYEYAKTKTKSDTNVYESYYISKLKPKKNVEGKYPDKLTVELPCIRDRDIRSIYK